MQYSSLLKGILDDGKQTKQFSFVFTSVILSDVAPALVEYLTLFSFRLQSNHIVEDRVSFKNHVRSIGQAWPSRWRDLSSSLATSKKLH